VKGGQIRVRLVDLEKASGFDPKLFVLSDPRRRVGVRRRNCDIRTTCKNQRDCP
jgi:hypothetical protein